MSSGLVRRARMRMNASAGVKNDVTICRNNVTRRARAQHAAALRRGRARARFAALPTKHTAYAQRNIARRGIVVS